MLNLHYLEADTSNEQEKRCTSSLLWQYFIKFGRRGFFCRNVLLKLINFSTLNTQFCWLRRTEEFFFLNNSFLSQNNYFLGVLFLSGDKICFFKNSVLFETMWLFSFFVRSCFFFRFLSILLTVDASKYSQAFHDKKQCYAFYALNKWHTFQNLFSLF